MEPTAGASGTGAAAVNRKVWSGASGRLLRAYQSRQLRPVEVVYLVRQREALSGRVLELGCGAGRVTGYLAEIAGQLEAVDIAPAMVASCRAAYPGVQVREGDMRDLARYDDASHDAVVIPFNSIDVLTHADRIALLGESRRVLVGGGTLILSSHNRGAAASIRPPGRPRTSDPLRFAYDVLKMPRRLLNRRSLASGQHQEAEYAIYNDSMADYSALNYYVSRAAMERQLIGAGFELVECLDLEGRPVAAGDDAPHCPELHYIARGSGA